MSTRFHIGKRTSRPLRRLPRLLSIFKNATPETAHLKFLCATLWPVNPFLLTTRSTMPGNPHPIPNWEPGKSGNPNGRPFGSRNKRTREIIEQIIASGNKDPLVTLSEIQDASPDLSIRATAASMLAPYLHGKVTPSPMPRFVETEIQLPPLDSLETLFNPLR